MKVTLRKITCNNFMGARSLSVDFTHRTDIYAANAGYKSTLYHAFNWLLFGKNSLDQKDFNIKTLDENNQPMHRADHFVEGVIDQDGAHITLKRAYKEKWVRRKGSATEVFDGHETLYFVNGVPNSAGDYQKVIDGIIPESRFKMLTNPHYFNSLKWETRRDMLFKLVHMASNSEIAGNDPEFIELTRIPSLDVYKKELAAKKSLHKKTIDDIPARIDELTKGMPVAVDETSVNEGVAEFDRQIIEVDEVMTSNVKQAELKNKPAQEKKTELDRLKEQLTTLNQAEEARVKNANQTAEIAKDGVIINITALKNRIAVLNAQLGSNTTRLEFLQKEREKLLENWHKKNAEVAPEFDPSACVCPACKRPLEATDIEAEKVKVLAAFNEAKKAELSNISNTGKGKAVEIAQLIESNKILQETLDKETKSLAELEEKQKEPTCEVVFQESDEMVKLKKQIETLQAAIPAPVIIDQSQLEEKKRGYIAQRDVLKASLEVNKTIATTQKRIDELSKEQVDLSQLIADLEKKEFAVDRFIKRKIEIIEGRINEKFYGVKFKMYNQLINGGEEPCCITLINGVPWEDANTAGRIWAGIEIISAFSRWSDTYCPIWIDNREGCTLIPETGSQVISLHVSPEDKVMRIVNQ